MNNEDLMPKFYTLEDMTQEDLNKLSLERNTFAKEISRLNNIIKELEKELKEFLKTLEDGSRFTDSFHSMTMCNHVSYILDKLKKLKEDKNDNR